MVSALKSVPVLSAKEQYSSVVLLSETSHVKLSFLDLTVIVLSVWETQDSVVAFPCPGSIFRERRKTVGELLLGVACR